MLNELKILIKINDAIKRTATTKLDYISDKYIDLSEKKN